MVVDIFHAAFKDYLRETSKATYTSKDIITQYRTGLEVLGLEGVNNWLESDVLAGRE